MTHLKKYWIWYAIAVVVVVVVIFNFETIKAWFTSPGTGRIQAPGSGSKQISCQGVRYNAYTGEPIPNSGFVTVDGLQGSARCPNDSIGI